ncbi:Ctf8-domain-containing protein [Obelidium mucronatum]|nr:Ctf8-domain-containing protein [Obelidium mucronatum]
MLISIPTTTQYPTSNGLLVEDSETQCTGQEWALVEVQGAVESAAEECLDGVQMGNVEFERVPFLVIGRHRLKGKRVNLKQPLAVLRQEISAESRECQVVCVLRHKYLFNERPVPILSEANIGLIGLAKNKR